MKYRALTNAISDRSNAIMTTPTANAPFGHDLPRKDVLVVDDVPEILDIFRGLVRRVRNVDARLTVEVNSQRALDLASSRPFDLVLSDFRMRQVDGIEVLRAARLRNPEGRRVLMTGYNEVPTSLARVFEAEVDAYVQKPLRSQDLLLLLIDMLQGTPSTLEQCRTHARALEDAALRGSRPLGLG